HSLFWIGKHGGLYLFFCFAHSAQKMVLHGKERRCGPRRDAGLIVDMLDMVLDGPLRDGEVGGNLAVGLSTGDESKDFDFTVTQARYPLTTHRPHTVPCDDEQGIDNLTIKTTCSDLPTHLGSSLFRGVRCAMRTWLGQSMIDI